MSSRPISTEPIGSIPRPHELLQAIDDGHGLDPALDPLYEAATRDTIRRFEATGSPVITDGEQRKYQNFWTYAVYGCSALPMTVVSLLFATTFRRFWIQRLPRFAREYSAGLWQQRGGRRAHA